MPKSSKKRSPESASRRVRRLQSLRPCHHRSREKERCGLKASSRHRDAAIADRSDDRRDDEGNRLAAAYGARLPAGVVRKKLKLKLNSKKIDGSRVYRVDGADSAKPSGRKSKSRAGLTEMPRVKVGPALRM